MDTPRLCEMILLLVRFSHVCTSASYNYSYSNSEKRSLIQVGNIYTVKLSLHSFLICLPQFLFLFFTFLLSAHQTADQLLARADAAKALAEEAAKKGLSTYQEAKDILNNLRGKPGLQLQK